MIGAGAADRDSYEPECSEFALGARHPCCSQAVAEEADPETGAHDPSSDLLAPTTPRAIVFAVTPEWSQRLVFADGEHHLCCSQGFLDTKPQPGAPEQAMSDLYIRLQTWIALAL